MTKIDRVFIYTFNDDDGWPSDISFQAGNKAYELQSCYMAMIMMVEKALGHIWVRLLNSRRNAAGIFDAGISNIQMSSELVACDRSRSRMGKLEISRPPNAGHGLKTQKDKKKI